MNKPAASPLVRIDMQDQLEVDKIYESLEAINDSARVMFDERAEVNATRIADRRRLIDALEKIVERNRNNDAA